MSEIPEPPDKSSQRHDLLGRFSNPWIGLLGLIFSVVGVGLAIYFYSGGARTRKLTYFVNPVKTIVVKAGEASSLRVLHGELEIRGDVTAAQVAIWNDGTESIRPENVLSPVVILPRPPVPILEAKIRKVSRAIIGAALDNSRIADGVVPVSWRILEHSDGAVIQLIFAGSTATDIAVEGTVEGQPTVLHVEPPLTNQLLAERRGMLHIAFSFCLSFVVGFLLLLLVKKSGRVELPPMETDTPWFATGIAAGIVSFYLIPWVLSPVGPPFGF